MLRPSQPEQKAAPSTAFFDAEELQAGRVFPTPTTLVAGGIATVYHALSLLNAAPPNIDYPESLRLYLGRRVEATTIWELLSRFSGGSPPVFVKLRCDSDGRKGRGGHGKARNR